MRLIAPALLSLGLASSTFANVVTVAAQADNTLFSESGTISNGAGDYIFTGNTASGFQRRALVRFDLTSAIPAGSTINSAQLVLFMSMTIVGTEDVELHRVQASWGEGTSNASGQEGGGASATTNDATWTDRFFSSTQWTTPGGDFAAAVSATIPVTSNGSYTWPSNALMIADVQGWLASPATNNGWLVKAADEVSVPTAKRFSSRTNPSATQRPKLIVDFTPPSPVQAFCFGDGSGTACPCGNAGAAGNGCASSVNAAGGNLAGSGTPSISNDTLSLNGSGMPNSSALYFQGTTQVNNGAGAVFGDGLRCAGGTVIRLGTKTNVGGASSYPSGSTPISIKGNNAAGNTRTYQCWYRNAAVFCTTSTFNLTNGLSVTWGA
jgi:hypothetical protein